MHRECDVRLLLCFSHVEHVIDKVEQKCVI